MNARLARRPLTAAAIALLGVIALAGAVIEPSIATAAWSPPSPRYAVQVDRNLAVPMRHGTVLRADVYRPADPHTNAPVAGRFPVLLTQTPYTKLAIALAGAVVPGGENPDPDYFASCGYIYVISDVRGSGAAGGKWGFFGPDEPQDGATLVRWAAGLPQSNGRVGLLGPSYMGIDELFTAAPIAAPRQRGRSGAGQVVAR